MVLSPGILRTVLIAAFTCLTYAGAGPRRNDEFSAEGIAYDEDVVILLQTAQFNYRRSEGEPTLAEAARTLQEDTLALHQLMAEEGLQAHSATSSALSAQDAAGIAQ